MEVTKKVGNLLGYDFYLKQDNKILKIVFGGNLDLYWILNIEDELKCDEIKETFIITKENYFIYSLFEKLMKDIKTANIYESKYPEDECKKWNERLKTKYYYNELFDSNTQTITWHSDEEEYSVADRVKINKVDDTYALEFIGPKLTRDKFNYRMVGSVSIRFRNSGSRYDEFYIPFMRMFNTLQDYNPNYHQIHIEELNHQKKLTLHK